MILGCTAARLQMRLWRLSREYRAEKAKRRKGEKNDVHAPLIYESKPSIPVPLGTSSSCISPLLSHPSHLVNPRAMAAPFSSLAILALSLAAVHCITIIVYRLYLHPLAKFPGPRIAAASILYRAYYQVWKDGKLLHHSINLHKKYGKSLLEETVGEI